MNVIPVPRPSKNAMNPDRPANTLLLSQVQHLREAERELPLRYRTEIYVKAIKTEGEAARYIREVTEAIHKAHRDAVAQRTKNSKRGIAIAAAAERAPRKATSKAITKKTKNRRKK